MPFATANPVRVLVADSHITVRSALRRLLDEEPELSLAGEVMRAKELLPAARSVQPDVVLLEWELPGLAADDDRPERGSALQNMRWLFYELHALSCHPHLVVLSGWPQAQKVAMLAGADAFLSKGSPPLQVLGSLRAIARQRRARQRRRGGTSPEDETDHEQEARMNIKNYRKVKAAQQDPGITLRWLISELEDAPNVAMKLMELAPATVGPVHTHAWEDEVFVLRGAGAVVGPDGEVAIGEGDVIYIPPRERHQFVNKGEQELCLLMAIPQSEQVTLAGGML
jgi:quercetin dioxygenase-like cupin family protein/CheY-like chemotaxis protein